MDKIVIEVMAGEGGEDSRLLTVDISQAYL